jgi:hypothetical protein
MLTTCAICSAAGRCYRQESDSELLTNLLNRSRILADKLAF